MLTYLLYLTLLTLPYFTYLTLPYLTYLTLLTLQAHFGVLVPNRTPLKLPDTEIRDTEIRDTENASCQTTDGDRQSATGSR